MVLSSDSQKIAAERYFIDECETWEGLSDRVSKYVGQNDKKYIDDFGRIIFDGLFNPAGRILRNCGRPRGTLFNCYVLPIGDSIEEIGDFIRDSLVLWSEGGGVGCNFSQLRPKDDTIMGKGGEASGPVSFMTAADAVAETIKSGGGRRAAALACLEVSHPDLIQFINSKMVDGNLSNFNISVGINNEFIEAVERDNGWTFKFNQKAYQNIPAVDIWHLILDNMIKYAEPGLLNFSNLHKNNSYYFDPVVSTNPCGEAVLAPHEVCCLGSLVLPKFVATNTKWQEMEQTIKLAIRFLDNVIDVNKYVLPQNKVKAFNSRRIGIGVMGLADYLFAKQLRYGSSEAINETERLFRFIRNSAYKSSIELAIEKGSFPKFDPVAYCKASFVRKLPAKLRMDIKEKGIRNVTLLSVAPTGTISAVAGTTSGIEPLFAKTYNRTNMGYTYEHPLVKEFTDKDDPDWFVDTTDLEPEDHLETQGIVQRYVDGAVSKTINLPKGTTTDQLDKWLLEYIKDLKGVTVYVDGSKEGQILTVDCPTGSCEM